LSNARVDQFFAKASNGFAGNGRLICFRADTMKYVHTSDDRFEKLAEVVVNFIQMNPL